MKIRYKAYGVKDMRIGDHVSYVGEGDNLDEVIEIAKRADAFNHYDTIFVEKTELVWEVVYGHQTVPEVK